MKLLLALSCLYTLAAARPGILAPLAYSAPARFHYYNNIANSPLAFTAPIARDVVAPAVDASVAPVVTVDKTQYHAQDVLGRVSYGHSEASQSHNAVQDAAGNKAGTYSYVTPDGQIFSTSYVADALGYRAVSNVLPAGPPVDPVTPPETLELLEDRAAKLRTY